MSRELNLNGDLPLYNALVDYIGAEEKETRSKLNEVIINQGRDEDRITSLISTLSRWADIADKHLPSIIKLIALFMLIVGGANIISICIQVFKH